MHKRLPSRSSLRRAAKVPNIHQVPVSAGLLCRERLEVQTSAALKKEPFCDAAQGQPGSDEGSPCGLDQVPSPGSLISSSSTPLIKNEQKQVGSLPCIRVWAVSEQAGFNKTYSPFPFGTVPLVLPDRAADRRTYLPSKRDGPTSTLALKPSAAWFPL